MVGTPLYQSPQILMRQWYNETVDTWALGCILFELVNGQTPFYGNTVDELLVRIKDGWYNVVGRGEPVYIETCMFLLESLQLHENNRMDIEGLLSIPLISEEYAGYGLHEIDRNILQSAYGFKQTQQSAAD